MSNRTYTIDEVAPTADEKQIELKENGVTIVTLASYLHIAKCVDGANYIISLTGSTIMTPESSSILAKPITTINGVDVSTESYDQKYARLKPFFAHASTSSSSGGGGSTTTTTTATVAEWVFSYYEIDGEVEYLGYKMTGATPDKIKRLTWTTTRNDDGVPVVSMAVHEARKTWANRTQTTGWTAVT